MRNALGIILFLEYMLNHPRAFYRLIVGICTMRRLHQVIIATIAVISLIGFLLYKHEYDRLNNLLHVLNTFGSSSECNPNYAESQKSSSNIAALGIWQQVENVYIYSAFGDSNGVKLLGVIPTSILVKDVSLARCLFWYELPESNQAFQHGDLKLDFMDSDSQDLTQENWRIVSMTCSSSKSSNQNPFAVSLLTANEPETDSQNNLLAMIRVQTLPYPARENLTIAVCAAIRSHQIDANLLQQFIRFHHHVGVNRFTFYDLGISPTIELLLDKLSSELDNLDVKILPWNFPFEFGDMKTTPAQTFMNLDCMSRHSHFNYVIFSTVSYLIMPKFHSHLTSLFKDEGSNDVVGSLQFTVHTFCMEFDDDLNTKSLGPAVLPMFLKTSWVDVGINPTDGKDLVIIKPSAVKTFSSNGTPILKSGYQEQQVSEDIAIIHSYKNCSPHSITNTHYDGTFVLRFLGRI